ncbi:hypothetical protein like AT5G43740 [Hibiscus trionum]|uniref:Uncharacterized protein n=1 Tax=Hibiscus trionum TaxID=183268 RepID=A0A9W7MAW4_HIBTR|nr:hypothetical protein like AT5G43740 [Hibiscus trionum]
MGNCLPLSCAVDAILICCWDFISGPTNYISHLEENLDALDLALEDLKALQDDVLWKVELAVKQLLKPLNRVQGWLSRTSTLIVEADKLLEDGPQEKNKLCLGGYFSENCMSSCEYGKKVAKMLAEIKDHISEGDFGTVAETEPTVLVEVRPIELPIGQESLFDEAWISIRDRDTGIIGLYGLGVLEKRLY